MSKEEILNIEDQFEASYNNLNKKLGVISTDCAVAVLVLQYFTAFYRIYIGTISNWEELFQYLVYYMFGTIILIGLGFTTIAFVEKRLHLNDLDGTDAKKVKQKQMTSIARVAMITWIIPLMHVTYPVVFIAPMACILASVVYGDAKLLKSTTVVTMVVLGVVFTINGLTRQWQLPDSYALQCIIAEAIMVLSYRIAIGLVVIEEQKEVEQWDAKEQERTDGLTGLWNRKKLNEVMENHYEILTVAMIDIDKFKNINDTFGHPFGDVVLRRLAAVIKEYETADIKGFRYGGEEFIVAFKGDLSVDKVNQILVDLKESFCMQAYEEHPEVKCTLSMGIASSREFFPINFKNLVTRADEALYTAKNTGRNKIVKAMPVGVGEDTEIVATDKKEDSN